jgi:hypothetical protein
MRRKQNAPTDLPEREWNFEDCPKDEILDCWHYEFAREIGWLKDIVERRRGPITLKTGHQTHIDTLTPFARSTRYSFLIRPDWPAQPYLSAPPEERQKWIDWTRLETDQEHSAKSLVPKEVPKGIELELTESLRDRWLGPRARVRSEDNRFELTLLRIDWARSDSVLSQAFESYLKEFRPISHPNVLHTGRTSPDSRRFRQLEKLGRFRLVRANNDSVALARATGHLVTSNANPWYEARKTVEELLRNAETRIIPRISRVELETFFTTLSTP